MKRDDFLSSCGSSVLNSLRFVCGVGVVILIASSCTNIGSKLASKSKVTTSTVTLSDPSTGGATSGSFMLTGVTPDPNNIGTMYDFLGTGSQFDSYCGGTYGTCMCEFTYNQPGVGYQTVDVAMAYQESNLIRCPSSSVPSGLSTFTARIIVVPTSASGATPTPSSSGTGASNVTYYSETITVNLASNGAFASASNYIDLTNPNSFSPVQKFQCRKRDFIANPLDSGIIDPFQSIDPRIVYPFNFYTTNVSESLLGLQRLNNQSWECTLMSNTTSSLPWWSNPLVFSVSPCTTSFCSGDQELMYPSTSLFSGKIPVSNLAANGKRRGSFYLANQPYGVFQTPVKAATAPNTYVAGTVGVIGYAAKPIPSVNGSSSCPAIDLPPKATWVKLWNYRATDITSPQIVTGSQSTTNSSIACEISTGSFPSCDAVRQFSGTAFGSVLPNVAGTLASRVALLSSSAGSSASSACYNIDQGPTSWPTAGSLVTPKDGSANETWIPSPYAFKPIDKVYLNANATAAVQMSQFPWSIYSQVQSLSLSGPHKVADCQAADASGNTWIDDLKDDFGVAVPNSCTYVSRAPAVALSLTPYDAKTQLVTAPLEPQNNNYTDQLFVVSDPAVDDSSMRNGAPSISQYTPITFRSLTDCPGPLKDNCPVTTNGVQGAPPIHWDINVKEVGNPTGADLYPLCVLQFYD